MKFILTSFFVFTAIFVFGQKELDELTYADCQDSKVFQEIKNYTTILKYTAADGSVLSLGDTLIIGVPTGSTTNTTVVGAGNNVAVAKARSNTKSSFSNIIMGRPAGVGNILNAMGGEAPVNAGSEMQGEIVVVSEMKVFHKGSRKKPLALQVLLGEPNGRAFGINKYMSVTDFEKAVLAGEIKSTNAPLTRDEAIAKLKESKDLLDLGIISQVEYDNLKEELTPVILQE